MRFVRVHHKFGACDISIILHIDEVKGQLGTHTSYSVFDAGFGRPRSFIESSFLPGPWQTATVLVTA